MTIGIVGRKAGMTRVFTEAGESIPVTVIECAPNRVTQVKTVEADGYRAVQVTFGEQKPQRVNKPMTGHFKKAGVAAGRGSVEFRLADGEGDDLAPGAELKVERFKDVRAVDVTGVSIGKGFAGTVKRWNFGGGRGSHGASLSHRSPGSIGQNQDPGRVFKGKKMSGQMGNKQVTAINLDVVKVDEARNLLLVRGAVPGSRNTDLVVKPTVKN